MEALPENKPLLLFDGTCVMCNGFASFVLKNDRSEDIHFLSLQDPRVNSLLSMRNGDGLNVDSVIFLHKGKIFIKSNAALEVLRQMGGIYILGYVFKLIPRFIRDGVYTFIAKNRKRWFGTADACFIPEVKYRKRLL